MFSRKAASPPSEQSIASQNAPKECRICLESGVDEALISPCNCTGSLKYVHSECLQSWIEKIVNKSKQDIEGEKAYILCELCLGKISFSLKQAVKCKSKEEVKTAIKKDAKMLIALVVLLLTNLGFMFALMNHLLRYGFRAMVKENEVLLGLLMSGQVTFSIVAAVTLGVIVNKFFLNRDFVVWHIVGESTA